MHPRVLLIDTNRWSLTARVAAALRSVGCRIGVVCPRPGHPVAKLRGLEQAYPYAGRAPIESLREAIEDFDPEIVIPFCDRAVQHLHELHASMLSRSESGGRAGKVRELIERSLGPATGFSVVSSRYDLMRLASDEGIMVPRTLRVETAEDLRRWREELPWLLKADGTWGGQGVREVNSIKHGEEALLELTARPGPFSLAKQLILNRNRDWTVAHWRQKRGGVIAQAFVEGRRANCTAVAWQGEILAIIAVEVLHEDGRCQPATMVRVVESKEMTHAAIQIARRLGLSGFFGLDFIIEDGTNDLYLIEMNPRCTPPCPVPLGEGRDLIAAIVAKLRDEAVSPRPSCTTKNTIAYFPNALISNNYRVSQEELEAAYVDVPSEQPELVQELLHPWSERSLAGRALDGLRRRLSSKKESREVAQESGEAGEERHLGEACSLVEITVATPCAGESRTKASGHASVAPFGDAIPRQREVMHG